MEEDPTAALGTLENSALNDPLVGSLPIVRKAINSEFM